MTYCIGDTLPPAKVRGITTSECDPAWYALIAAPRREHTARAYFRNIGFAAFYPSAMITRTIRGKRTDLEYPIVSRHIYVRFTATPQWDVIKQRLRCITGVYCIGSIPITIPEPLIAHLRNITVEAERLEMANEAMAGHLQALRRARVGHGAEIIKGPLAGFMVNVEAIQDGTVFFSFPSGGKGKADLASVARVDRSSA